MDKPQVGDLVRITSDADGATFTVGRVYATYDKIDVWWETPTGENKVALMDLYDEEKLATAKWFAEVENADDGGETMAVASFECDPFPGLFELAVRAIKKVYQHGAGDEMSDDEYSFEPLIEPDDNVIFECIVAGVCRWEGFGGGENFFVAQLKQHLAHDDEDWTVRHLVQYTEGEPLIAEFDEQGNITNVK